MYLKKPLIAEKNEGVLSINSDGFKNIDNEMDLS